MDGATWDLVLLALAWAAYFTVHSVLASLGLKHWVAAHWPAFMPAYRLCFNAAALALIAPILWFGRSLHGAPLWQWTGIAWWIANGLALAAVGGFIWSLRYYDGQEFLGLRQWRAKITTAEDQERFHLSPLHRFVRHPWYFLALVMVWTRDMDPAFLITALAVTLYFIVGSRLEERKLLAYHGEVYRRYMARVPALLPLPWRYLSKNDAGKLIQFANERSRDAGPA